MTLMCLPNDIAMLIHFMIHKDGLRLVIQELFDIYMWDDFRSSYYQKNRVGPRIATLCFNFREYRQPTGWHDTFGSIFAVSRNGKVLLNLLNTPLPKNY